MKYLVFIFLLYSCSSSQKIKDLEEKIALLEKEQKSNIKKEEDKKKKATKSKETEEIDKTQLFKINLPKSEFKTNNEVKKRISLGIKQNYNVDFLFVLGQYWVELHGEQGLDPTLELQLIIDGGGVETKESLNLIKEEDESRFYAFSHQRVGKTKFTLIMKSKKYPDESISFEVNLR